MFYNYRVYYIINRKVLLSHVSQQKVDIWLFLFRVPFFSFLSLKAQMSCQFGKGY